MIHPRKTAKSFGYAGRGLAKAWREEHNFRFEFLVAIFVIALAFFLNLSGLEIAVLTLACGLVLTLELVNTMIEFVADLLKPRLDNQVKQLKDLTAAAVFVAAIVAAIVGLCLLVPAALNFSWQ